MRVAPARRRRTARPQSSSFGPTLSNHGASIALAGPLCTRAETARPPGGMLRAAGAVQPPGQVRGRWEEFPACGAVPEPQEGARRAGPLPPPAVGGGGHRLAHTLFSEPTTTTPDGFVTTGQSLPNAHWPLLCFQWKTKVRKAAEALNRLRGCKRRAR